MTAELNRVAAIATSAQLPCRTMRMRSGSTTPNPEVAALMGTNPSSQGRAMSRRGHVRSERTIVRGGAYKVGLKMGSTRLAVRGGAVGGGVRVSGQLL